MSLRGSSALSRAPSLATAELPSVLLQACPCETPLKPGPPGEGEQPCFLQEPPGLVEAPGLGGDKGDWVCGVGPGAENVARVG